mmetsp:Transcript_77337/g.154965  ORF Transcript_77337/g.154965 Transcript_77337/m.154965 type:complete len:574 (+) Transcript_77337:120-1841(+)
MHCPVSLLSLKSVTPILLGIASLVTSLTPTENDHYHHHHHHLESYAPVSGAGINVVDIFWERISSALGDEPVQRLNSTQDAQFKSGVYNNEKHSLLALKQRGIDLVRFAASPYCPSHLALWRLGGENASLYWNILDSVFDEADSAGVRLIPVIMWRAILPSISCGESIGRLFESDSCSHGLLHNYTTSLVRRYQSRKSVVAWELKNELNLHADFMHRLPHSSTTKLATAQQIFSAPKLDQRKLTPSGNCHWVNYKRATVCKKRAHNRTTRTETTGNESSQTSPIFLPLNADHSTAAVSSPGQEAFGHTKSLEESNNMSTPQPQCLSTAEEDCSCNRAGRGKEDGYSTQSMIMLDRLHAGWVRSNDPVGRPLSSGHAMPRPNAWHAAHPGYVKSSIRKNPRGSLDTFGQFCENLLETHAEVELASIHPYVKLKLGKNGTYMGTDSWKDDEAPFSFGDGKPMRMIDFVRRAQLCIENSGRTYPKQLFLGEFGFRQGDNVTLQFVRDALSLTSSHGVDNSTRTLPALATIWIWEFPAQSGLGKLSLEAGRDEWLLQEIATANKLARDGVSKITPYF